MEEIKSAFRGFFNKIEDYRQFTGYYDKIQIPPTPKGNEERMNVPKIGDVVEMTSSSTMKTGLRAIVLDVHFVHGFARIVTDKCGTQRLQDVKIATNESS
jgi:hypothetical protein